MKTLRKTLTAIVMLMAVAMHASAQEQQKPLFGYISYACELFSVTCAPCGNNSRIERGCIINGEAAFRHKRGGG